MTQAVGRGSHILLTGGTGFFGRALLRHWAAQPDELQPQVTVLTRSPQRLLDACPEFSACAWLRFHVGDMVHPESLPAFEGFTHLLHAAADSTHGAALTPLRRFDQIVNGTRNMLNHAVVHRIPRFLFVSSGAVYGSQPLTISHIPESYHGAPDSLDVTQVYGVAKRCAEQLCALYQESHRIDVVIARCFTFVGRDLPTDAHFAIGNFIRDAQEARDILVNGDGTPIRSYMDQRDLAHWLNVLLGQGHAGQAYNVGSDKAITIADLASLVRDLLAPDRSVRIVGDPSRQGMRNVYVPSIAKAQQAHGLSLGYPLAVSIPEAARHTRFVLPKPGGA